MAFKKLNEVGMLEAATDATNILVEDGGEIKRVAQSAIAGGGSGGGVQLVITPFEDYWKANMTFEEFKAVWDSGEPFTAVFRTETALEPCLEIQYLDGKFAMYFRQTGPLALNPDGNVSYLEEN